MSSAQLNFSERGGVTIQVTISRRIFYSHLSACIRGQLKFFGSAGYGRIHGFHSAAEGQEIPNPFVAKYESAPD
jgi:hypothetical protein